MSDESLSRIIYLSRAVQTWSVPALDVLLAAARAQNAGCGITGFLAFHEGCFLQVLEGPAEAVARVFASIERDGRHSDIVVARRETGVARAFAEWSMGFADPAQLGMETMRTVTDLREVLDVAGPQDRQAVMLLNSFLASFHDLAQSPWRASECADEPVRQVS